MTAHAAVQLGPQRFSIKATGLLPHLFWTCIGALAIPLWAMWPALSLQMRQVPAFECLTLVFLTAWLALLVLQPATAHSREDSESWGLWMPALVFALAECGSAGFFLLAQRYIAAAEGNLIVYLWPGMVVGAAAALGLLRVRRRQLFGVAIGFAGAAILIWGGNFSLSIKGIGLAMAGGASWAAYCVFRLKWPRAATGFLSRGCAIATITCGVLHLCFEPSVLPGLTAAAAAITTGIIPTAIATIAWDKGIRSGDSQLLAVMAYGTPLCSALLLAALGLETLTVRLAIGAVVIVCAGIMSRTDTT